MSYDHPGRDQLLQVMVNRFRTLRKIDLSADISQRKRGVRCDQSFENGHPNWVDESRADLLPIKATAPLTEEWEN